jgi:hypothetical protein
MSGEILTARDPEPIVMTLVRDDLGSLWRRWPEGYWLREDGDGTGGDGDPESWVKVAGNYGPVTVLP